MDVVIFLHITWTPNFLLLCFADGPSEILFHSLLRLWEYRVGGEAGMRIPMRSISVDSL